MSVRMVREDRVAAQMASESARAIFRVRRTITLMRCERHGLALGPDGSCVLCRRDRPSDSPRARSHVPLLLLVLAVLTLAGVALPTTMGNRGTGCCWPSA